MTQLLTQQDVRAARELPFCYLCGDPILKRSDRHPDHVPPKAIFSAADRDFPVKVAAHQQCNTDHSARDRVLGQLISVVHGKYPSPDDCALETQTYTCDEFPSKLCGIKNLDLLAQIKRWVRAFHTALYREFLPDSTPFAVHPPVPHGKLIENGFTIDKIKEQQNWFVAILKRNRAAHCLDRIVSNNGKLRYECVWSRRNETDWACVFALNIYDWSSIGDHSFFDRRGCVGYYEPVSGPVDAATRESLLEFEFANNSPLDPFGD